MRLLLIGLLLVLVGCGGNAEDTAPQITNTPAPTPTLPFEERVAFPAGQVENPIQMMIRPVDAVRERVAELVDESDDLNAALQRDFGVSIDPDLETVDEVTAAVQNALGERVSAAILEQASLYVDVVLVESYAEAFSALCESSTGLVTAPWLDSMTYLAAVAQGCGQPALQVARGTNGGINLEATPEATPEVISVDDLQTGTAGVMIANESIGASGVGVVPDRVLCRVNIDDFYSWFLPTLVLEQAGIDPLRDPAEIVDYPDYDALAEAVAEGDCDVAGLPSDTLETSDTDFDVIETTPAFPYNVLVYPLELQLGVRLSLSENLIALDDNRPLRLLLGHDALLPAEAADFEDISIFVSNAGYDLTVLGE